MGPRRLTHFGLGVPMAEFYLLPRLRHQVEGSLEVVPRIYSSWDLAEMLNETSPTDFRKNISAMGSAATGFTQDAAQVLGLLSVLRSDISTEPFPEPNSSSIQM